MKKRLTRYHRKLRGNNRGMTLVEIIIAMAIFAVVAVPTLHIFVSSSRHNLFSRRQQRATTIGESVMESFKAYSMADIVEQFDKNGFRGAPGSPTMTYTAVGVTNVWDTEPAFLPPPNSAVRTPGVLDPNATAYNFELRGAELEGERYDIFVNVTPEYAADVLKMDKVNKYKDAVVTLDEQQLAMLPTDDDPTNPSLDDAGNPLKGDLEMILKYQVAEKLKNANPNSLNFAAGDKYYDIEFTKKTTAGMTDVNDTALNRYITATVKFEFGGDKVDVSVYYTTGSTVKINYKYLKAGASTTVNSYNLSTGSLRADILPKGDSMTSKVWTAYDNTSTAAGCLDNLYLYYMPAYAKVVGFDVTDNIVIDKQITSDLNVTVMKQISEKLGSNLADVLVLNQQDQAYSSLFNLVGTGGGMKLRTNLQENVLTGVKDPTSLTGAEVSHSAYGSIPATQLQGFDSVEKFGDSTETIKRKVLLYHVKISVRYAGDSNDISVYEGTVNG